MGTFKIPEISARDASERLKTEPKTRLIDVRTNEEYAIAKIAGATLVNGEAQLAELMKLPKDTPLIIHCHHGMRSMQAAGFFLNQGFQNVVNLAGGIDAWSQDVDPAVPRY
jgi:monothiol glutaredoxin